MDTPEHTAPNGMREVVEQTLEHAGHVLPDQAPIRVFIHHNTLHAFQHLHFHDAVLKAQEVYGAEPYLSEQRFREYLSSGRITNDDLEAALRDQLGEPSRVQLVAELLDLHALRMLQLHHALEHETAASFRWKVLEQGVIGDAGSDDPADLSISALWHACRELAEGYVAPAVPTPRGLRQHRDVVLEQYGQDVYDLVFPPLIRLAAAYLDDGLAHQAMPQRELGFYRAVRALVAHGSRPVSPWLRAIKRVFTAQEHCEMSAMDVVIEVLSDLGVTEHEAPTYLERMLLTLPGFGGMMSRLERHPDDRPPDSPKTSLLDFLAVRLVYERAALRKVLGNEDEARALAALRREPHSPREAAGDHGTPYRLFRVMQLAGIPVQRVRAMSHQQAHDILRAMDDFNNLTRRRIFQEAFEHHHRKQTLNALTAHRAKAQVGVATERPCFQMITCFDEREESFRRHLEEVEPDCQTYGAPGFFGAAMRFRAVDEHKAVAFAPVVIIPTHEIEERPRPSDLRLHEARLRRRRLLSRVVTHLQRGSQSLWRGTLLNTALGLLAAFPLLARILSPRSAGNLRRFTSELLLPSPRTELAIHHDVPSDVETSPPRTHQMGFKIDERVTRVAAVLENIGLTQTFAPLVIVLGHGATTLNNPHKSAYDCGACGGRQGGPNARVFCKMANEPEVRRALSEGGIHIPDDTWFIGGQHDTCSDAVILFDADRVPEAHREFLADAMRKIDRARALTAQERCRRLFSAPDDPAPDAALRHVEARSEHLAEPRPEFGHATNALAVIGRRALTRGLFLDRRAFLLSYDPTCDATGSVLERTLAAATPVGAGINLEYYFSHVDNMRYGAGSKLPHNIMGLIAVMSGHASDLRTGLPRQMIEIHEPLRLLVIVEATPERLLEIAERQAEVHELVVKRWIQLVSCDPQTGAMHVFTDRGFQPYTAEPVTLPQAETSRGFYRGHHGFLPPASIARAKERAA